jgi:hypothetical protein
LVKACGDKVPNVQFNVCKIIKLYRKNFDQTVLKDQIVPKLKELAQDGDEDVAYYAKVAMEE